ncbi:MAG TPA: ABC transporter ATP-binding protein, partial [Chthoniobacteraceae bacterium]|jgi:lipopolysaccharide transport system ATP-binding protein
LGGTRAEEFWALRDISFELQQGEVLGILGHNGAGKSTLLKILAQITAPSSGRVCIRGRIASLLEVGTGFHPDLTGRDNVFLNGSILGMTTREVARKFDEIAAFSGVEQFLDTPVKRYSSGMRVRLAFAVAAHLEPEILIIDEVLSVGDASFQKKCLGKISSVAQEGRTVIFVSHNSAAVENLCRRGIVLDHGKMVFDGTQTEAISRYLQMFAEKADSLEERTDRTGTGELRVVRIEFRDEHSQPITTARSGQDVEVWLYYEKHTANEFLQLGARIFISNALGVPVFAQSNRLTETDFQDVPAAGAFVCRIPRLPLAESSYKLSFRITSEAGSGVSLDALRNAAELHVVGGNYFGHGKVPPARDGFALVDGKWRIENASSSPATSADVATTAP